jgi:hypothetical protein
MASPSPLGRCSIHTVGVLHSLGPMLVEMEGKMNTLDALLEATAARHAHLCPKQVLGARMGLLAGALIGIELPQHDKRLLVIMETDGCTADGIAVATGCSVGHRTLRVEDYGKVAATFVDTHTERTLRIVPQLEARSRAQPMRRMHEGGGRRSCSAISGCLMSCCFPGRKSGWSRRSPPWSAGHMCARCARAVVRKSSTSAKLYVTGRCCAAPAPGTPTTAR